MLHCSACRLTAHDGHRLHESSLARTPALPSPFEVFNRPNDSRLRTPLQKKLIFPDSKPQWFQIVLLSALHRRITTVAVCLAPSTEIPIPASPPVPPELHASQPTLAFSACSLPSADLNIPCFRFSPLRHAHTYASSAMMLLCCNETRCPLRCTANERRLPSWETSPGFVVCRYVYIST